jgi:hypothetical protein
MSLLAVGLTACGGVAWARLVVGQANTISNDAACVTGGAANTASGTAASITGGQSNSALEPYSTVVGGNGNEANAQDNVVLGGINVVGRNQGGIAPQPPFP